MKTTAKTTRSKRDPSVPSGATLVEVAEAAGVSASTVSRILNGTARVSSDKRKAVEKAIADLNFTPNVLAQSLKRGQSMTIGVVTQALDSPFFNETLKGIEEGLAGSGYAALIVSGHWNPEEEAERVALLMARKVDGIIMVSGNIPDDQIVRFSEQVPIVATGHGCEAENARAIRVDNVWGGYRATRHLIELGHRQIAHIAGMPNLQDANDRLLGYKHALEDARIPFDEALVVQGDFRESGGMLCANQLLDRGVPFSAVFAANDQTAYGARLAFYRRGIRVPEDISLIGFDDLPGSLYTTPPLTTMRQPVYEIGHMAAGAVLGLITNKPFKLEQPQVELMIRETTRRLR